MKHLIENGYKQVEDPYDCGRTCFEVKFAGKELLDHILNDEKFYFYSDNIVYFNI